MIAAIGRERTMSEIELRGTVHGKTIELDQDAGLPQGQVVSVVVRPVDARTTPGEGLLRSFGGWAEDDEGLDEFLDWNRRQRKVSRTEMDS
jgi:hypothetical protein